MTSAARSVPPRPVLSVMLREGTTEAHRAAERGPLVRELLRGRISRVTYTRLLAALHRVYTALEAGLVRHRGHPVVGAMVLPEVFRAAALAADLHALAGPDWAQTVPASPAAERYAARLRELAEHEPERLVAHAYTRYLGDLSGGQILGKRAATALGLAPGPGLLFWEFPDIADITVFKAEFRARLDGLPLAPAAAAAIVDEANLAFAATAAIFAELA